MVSQVAPLPRLALKSRPSASWGKGAVGRCRPLPSAKQHKPQAPCPGPLCYEMLCPHCSTNIPLF